MSGVNVHVRGYRKTTLPLDSSYLLFFKFNFLSEGLKYQEETVATSNINDGTASVNGCPTTRWEIKAPDMVKKKPA